MYRGWGINILGGENEEKTNVGDWLKRMKGQTPAGNVKWVPTKKRAGDKMRYLAEYETEEENPKI